MLKLQHAGPAVRRVGRSACLVLCKDKRDRKAALDKQGRRKPKQEASSIPQASAPPSQAPPPRIQTNSLVSVRAQQRFLAQVGAWAGQESAVRREAARYRSTCAALTQLYGSCRLAAPPVLLVDGYNVMHKLPACKPLLAAGDLEAAREAAVEALGVLSSRRSVRVVAAFDALRGPCASQSQSLTRSGVTVVFCGAQEADSYLQGAVTGWVRDPACSRVVVASSDAMVKTMVEASSTLHGADTPVVVVSATSLVAEIAAAKKEVAAALHASALRRGPNRLGAAVAGSGDGSVYSRLHQLRLRLARRPRGGEAPGP
ncbi:hypothetical protein APUTEX25_003651 [Auxenochlorella protothecoides]|uniref:Uncharacterized protein n=1 Tax=Auxenochlorella protothecoides TaxID=3075 RepID=A0A3M7KPN4_AUXPR|nr:hypothetical protein APUTEX25_003651 [Auxenochlorella protothecoides]|eukprot:RMZ52508.1 hypothetical protein APUTEX25_003651 [Auxenochlorella protothecoides]